MTLSSHAEKLRLQRRDEGRLSSLTDTKMGLQSHPSLSRILPSSWLSCPGLSMSRAIVSSWDPLSCFFSYPYMLWVARLLVTHRTALEKRAWRGSYNDVGTVGTHQDYPGKQRHGAPWADQESHAHGAAVSNVTSGLDTQPHWLLGTLFSHNNRYPPTQTRC